LTTRVVAVPRSYLEKLPACIAPQPLARRGVNDTITSLTPLYLTVPVALELVPVQTSRIDDSGATYSFCILACTALCADVVITVLTFAAEIALRGMEASRAEIASEIGAGAEASLKRILHELHRMTSIASSVRFLHVQSYGR